MALKKVKWSLLTRQGAKEACTCYQSSPWRVLGAQQDKSSPGGIETFRKGFICLHRALGNVLAQALPKDREEVSNNFDSDILAGQASRKQVSMGVKLCLPLRSYEIQADVICSLF